MKEVVFYYDVVCPFAFMASKLIEGVARRTGAIMTRENSLFPELSQTTDFT